MPRRNRREEVISPAIASLINCDLEEGSTTGMQLEAIKEAELDRATIATELREAQARLRDYKEEYRVARYNVQKAKHEVGFWRLEQLDQQASADAAQTELATRAEAWWEGSTTEPVTPTIEMPRPSRNGKPA